MFLDSSIQSTSHSFAIESFLSLLIIFIEVSYISYVVAAPVINCLNTCSIDTRYTLVHMTRPRPSLSIFVVHQSISNPSINPSIHQLIVKIGDKVKGYIIIHSASSGVKRTSEDCRSKHCIDLPQNKCCRGPRIRIRWIIGYCPTFDYILFLP